MFLYLPIENDGRASCAGGRRTFGLRVLWSEKEEDRELMILPDISTDFGFTLRLASLLTKKQLDPLCLPDILETLL